jgi:hypothetical protein
LRQECTLSPLSFNCYAEKIINLVKTKFIRLQIWFRIGGETIFMIRFADDLVIITESEGNLWRAINEIAQTLNIFKIKSMKKRQIY